MNDRLAWRIFGLIYAHPQPKSPDTTIIRNKDGLPLPTDFDGGIASDFLLSEDEQDAQTRTMQAICLACHDTSWVQGIGSDSKTRSPDQCHDIDRNRHHERSLDTGLCPGTGTGPSPFDEAVERKWSDAWLFYANTVRFASAMAGGGDYGVFADGRYQLSQTVAELARMAGTTPGMENLATKP